MKSAGPNAGEAKNTDEVIRPAAPGLGRRDLMKTIGAGVMMTTLGGGAVAAQEESAAPARGGRPSAPPSGVSAITRSGYKNDANRLSGNGPMDGTSRQIVSYVTSLSEATLTDGVVAGLRNTVVDSIAALIAGFDSEPGRIGAKMGRMNQSEMKCTIAGWGVVTNPESAAFANSAMVRETDYNDGDPEGGGHNSVIIPGILAIGEALHSTGTDVMVAIALGYELLASLQRAARTSGSSGGWDGPYEGMATALACGKLMGLNEDKLANALSIALVPHMPLAVTHVGALSMWKSCHSAIGVRNGVYAALLAREGMTGPAAPFEERAGLWDKVTGPFKELHLPLSPDRKMAIENFRMKRYAAEGNTQAMLQQAIPPIREFVKVQDIESIHVDMDFGAWQEIADPPKFDPRNRETADHSMPYILSVALTDGEVYLNSFTPKRYLEDAAIKDLMGRITCQATSEFDHAKQGRTRFTVRTKSGTQMVKEVYEENPVKPEEVVAKFNRVCQYMSVPDEKRDRARTMWSDLRKVHDIAEPMRDLAHFGRPLTA